MQNHWLGMDSDKVCEDSMYLLPQIHNLFGRPNRPKHFPLKYRITVNYIWNISIKLCKPCEIRTNVCIMWWIVRTHFTTQILFKSLFYLNDKFTLSREMLVCEKYAPLEKIASFCWLFGEFLQKFWFPGTKVLHKKGYFFWSTGLANISFKYSKKRCCILFCKKSHKLHVTICKHGFEIRPLGLLQ